MALDPKSTDAVVIAINIARDSNQPDSAIAIAQRGIAAGADKTILEPVLLGPIGVAVKKAQESKERGDWEGALQVAESIDKTSGSPATKFFVGLSSFQVGLDALQTSQKLGGEKGKDAKESKVKACAEAKVAEDMWATAQIAITAGGSYNPQGAAGIMTNIQQYGEYIPQMKKQCCTAK
ncbi:MAG: hypothetical protein ABI442_12235 [Gemmatimonadaceae bacterium]